MVPWRALVPLGCASLALGALTPWVVAQPDNAQGMSSRATSPVARPGQGPDIAAAAAPEPKRQGAIAIGDAVMLEAKSCLEARGVAVYPEPVRNVDELLAAIESSVDDQAAVLIHAGTESGIVDGQVSLAIEHMGPGRRVVWATIQIPDPAWGAFSFEERTNASIRNVVSEHDEGRVLDWNAATMKHPEWTVDGIHISPEGCREYAGKVVKLAGLPRHT